MQENHTSEPSRAEKISATMRRKKLDNFKSWRDTMKTAGKIRSSYPPLTKNGDLAELIGTILGDGHIYKHDRCDSIRIVGDRRKMGFIYRSADLLEKVFGNRPTIRYLQNKNTVTVTLYQKHMASRIGLPNGSRAKYKYLLPAWMSRSKIHKIRFPRGLYEAEGYLGQYSAKYTHKFIFTSRNPHLLSLVAGLVRELGYTICVSGYTVQVSRKAEVQKLADLLQFRRY